MIAEFRKSLMFMAKIRDWMDDARRRSRAYQWRGMSKDEADRRAADEVMETVHQWGRDNDIDMNSWK